jgi:hypothetical protein
MIKVLQDLDREEETDDLIFNFLSPYEKLATLVVKRLLFLLQLSNHKELFNK